MKPRFLEAIAQSKQLKKLKSRPVKRFQESLIIKTLLAGLRGK